MNIPENLPLFVFFEDAHSYFHTPDMEIYPSMSGLVKWYSPPFEGDYWLYNKAIREVVKEKRWVKARKDARLVGRENGIPPIEFLQALEASLSSDEQHQIKIVQKRLKGEWKIKNALGSTYGTRYHHQREEEDRKAGGAENPVTFEWQEIPIYIDKELCDNHSLTDRLEDLPDGYYPELLVFDLAAGICGQVDRCWIWTDEEGERWFAFSDYKSNWDKRTKSAFGTLLYPFDNYPDDATHAYAIQQGGYAMIMERAGFSFSGFLNLEWVQDFGKKPSVHQNLPYLRDEIQQAFTLLELKKSLNTL